MKFKPNQLLKQGDSDHYDLVLDYNDSGFLISCQEKRVKYITQHEYLFNIITDIFT